MAQENSQGKNTFISWTKQIEIVCKHLNLWGVYVNASDAEAWECNDVNRALHELRKHYSDEFFSRSVLNCDLVTFDTKLEAFAYYEHFSKAPLESSCVYAAIISPQCGVVNENT